MKLLIKCLIVLAFILVSTYNFAQNRLTSEDTLTTRILPELTLVGRGSKSDIHQLPQIVGTSIYAGKKSSLVVMDNVQGNIVSNTMRQVLGKLPGIFIWESESSGIQIGIAARGLSPNRSWEFNIRQNGFDIAADPFGYPEAYYNPQLQSVQRIEIVRGHGSLQYGPQLGGMVNYILKNGSEFKKPFEFETNQTLGSNGLFNSYNAIGGNTKKINYYAFYDHRSGNGWRDNSQFRSETLSGTITYKLSSRLSLTTEITKWASRSQQAGGLTDSQYQLDPQQSVRARNWFDLSWLTPGITADYKISSNQHVNVKMFGIVADRNSVGFFPSGGILIKDTINTTTGTYNSRTIDIDKYRNFGAEARYLLQYNIGKQQSNLSAGLRLYRGNTFRYRGGVGTTGTDYSIDCKEGSLWVSDINYQSGNVAVFAENLFQITDKLLLVPGIRYEYIISKAGGYNGLNNNVPVAIQDQSRSRGFLLAGLGFEYSVTRSTALYANATQSYRAVQFADLTAAPTTDVIDTNLTDAKGLNVDVGYRGNVKNYLKFDVSLFLLDYQNRIGTIRQQRQDGTFYNLRTNVGSSTTTGVEAFAESNISESLAIPAAWGNISLFVSYAYNNARYNNFRVVTVVSNQLSESNYKGKRVEYAPEIIFRAGVTYTYRSFSATLQRSYTDKVFTDANNTEAPSANGQNGLIPAYTVDDVTISYQHKTGVKLKAGVNNLGDLNYFTRRSGGYPGPGLLPSDGRTFFFSLGYVLR
jgi:Fe(3+) dicitrate transport protein